MATDAVIAAIALWMTYAVTSLEFMPSSIIRLWWLLPLATSRVPGKRGHALQAGSGSYRLYSERCYREDEPGSVWR